MRRILMIAILAIAASGCSHAMRITNLDQYKPPRSPPLDPQRTIGVTAGNATDATTREYVDAIASGLSRDGSFTRVIYPYDGRGGADFVVDIRVEPRYSGEPTNFFVNWPGFLIFAPAIWGYGYQAQIDTSVSLRASDGATGELAIPTVFKFRQAEADRTWTELGWFEVGIIPLIGGLVFTQYDTDVTPEFVSKVAPTYGSYVAQRIRESIATLKPAEPPRTADAVPGT